MAEILGLFEAVPKGLVAAAGLLCLAACQTAVKTDAASTLPPAGDFPLVPATDEPSANARAEFGAGNFGLAERKFREAVEKNPDDAASWIGLAASYDNLKRFDLADRAYARAIRLGGPTVEILNNRGYSYMLRGDGRRALAEFRQALVLDPDNLVLQNNVRLLRAGQRPSRTTRL